MFAVIPWDAILPLIGTMVGGGFLAGAVKVKLSGAQKDTISMAASKAAVDVYESSITRLEKDLLKALDRVDAQQAEINVLRQQVLDLTSRLRFQDIDNEPPRSSRH